MKKLVILKEGFKDIIGGNLNDINYVSRLWEKSIR